MRKRLGIIVGIVAGVMLIPNVVVLASHGINGWQAFLATQTAMLDGLTAYFDALLDLFKLVIGA